MQYPPPSRVFAGLYFKIGCTTFSKHPMPAMKTPPPDASALWVKESAFSGTELSLPMLGEAIATQNFHATPISWHAHERYELLMLLRGGALYEFGDGREFELAGGQMLLVPPLHMHRPSRDVRTPSIICALNFHTATDGTQHCPIPRRYIVKKTGGPHATTTGHFLHNDCRFARNIGWQIAGK
ncbi:MAG: hypothetical protein EBY21_13980 [Alphaproteobacteria bacterium]|nr:hypothetical protein [Alphaproteobacteria bacterium]